MTNKYLEKIAFSYRSGQHVFDTFERRALKSLGNKSLYHGAGIGGVVGGAAGALETNKRSPYSGKVVGKLSTGQRIANVIAGATVGAAVGLGTARMGRTGHITRGFGKTIDHINEIKYTRFKERAERARKEWEDFAESFSREGSGTPTQSPGDLKSHLKAMGVPESLKTKAEILKFHKSFSSQNHPDKFPGDATKAAKLAEHNAHWNKVKNHPDFEKMAAENIYLEKMAEMYV